MRRWKLTHVATGKFYITKGLYDNGRALMDSNEFGDALDELPSGEFSFAPFSEEEIPK